MLTQYVIAFYVTALTHFILAVLIYAKGRHRLTNITYALYSVAISWWSGLEAIAVTRADAQVALFWWRFNHVGVIFIPVFFAHFVISLLEPRQQLRRRHVVRAVYLFGIICLILDATPILIGEVVPKFSFRFFINPGLIYHVFFGLWVSLAIYGLIELFKIYVTSARAKRNQLTYFCWSMFVAYLGGIPNFLPTFNIEIPYLMPFGTYAIPLYALATAYAIVRYRLMDINVAITRTVVFAVVYALVLGLPLAGALAWQTQLEQALGAKWWVWLWVVCAFLATAAHYLNLYLQSKAEGRLLWEQRRYQATLLQASHGMTQVRDLKRLLNMIVHVITKAVGVSHAAVYLEDPKEGAYVLSAYRYKQQAGSLERLSKDDPLLIRWLREEQEPLVLDELKAKFSETASSNGHGEEQADILTQLTSLNASVVVPSFMQDQLIGFLVLGEKRDGRIFTTEDLDVFSTLANQAALAIENARFFDELKANEAFMIQSEKMASLGQLASGMAHEIHNPLAIISGEAQLYLERAKGGDGEIDKLLRSIIEECFRAADITRRILRFAKPGAAEAAVAVDLRAVVEESLQLVSYQVRLERIERRIDIPPDLPRVKGNQNQLQEVVLNLILNACQAMGERGGKIAVSAKPVDGEVELTVSDNGPGISRAKLSRIFDPFYTTKSGGTGLGLFVSHRIIRAHNGTIAAQSAEGHGTTFTIRLPVIPHVVTTADGSSSS